MLRLVMFSVLLIFCKIYSVDSVAEDCATSKRETRCSSIFEDLQNCYNATFKPMLGDCLVTCSACESYKCSNPQPETTLNCSALASQCDSATFSEFMKEKCPATCGKCNRKNANLCSDKSKSEVCTTMATFCNTIDYYDLLSEECPSTCNRCPHNGTNPNGNGGGNGGDGNQACTDVANDCSTNLARCSDAQYAPLMHRLCPKTCNSCKNCEDFHKMCSTWVSHGFCTKYSPAAVMKTCPKSCDLCK
ncbi:hypothetical protein GCK72_009276 [Caenorhabditis remanei]|uniref:ShKT domain-containing protein n=1 Tax=Caenorhabditis remanei TaxID=31234 RepID=A0A6A5H3B4_CAERE|nr:hypothetical protein GCK72_009276 [Caenorhabditis remanei]KAF1761023.1 hypothetical protein GCK72_009276 [Caenorhabditis remanei]